MALRSIVCLHSGYDFEASSLATAIELAKTHGAYLRIVHASYVHRPTAGFYGEAALAGAGWEDMIEKNTRSQIDQARKSAEALCARHGIDMQVGPSTDRPRAAFVPMLNYQNRTLVRDLSVSDLIVIGADKGSSGIIEQSVTDLALFSTGRPVLVVRPLPGGAAAPIAGGTCGIAWNDSEESVRALLNGLNVCRDARAAHLLVTKEKGASPPTDDQTLALDYLHAHDVNIQLDVIERGDRAPAEAVLARARELGCDYIAMGAYGHSVFRQTLLGGFSETMLELSEIPLLLSH